MPVKAYNFKDPPRKAGMWQPAAATLCALALFCGRADAGAAGSTDMTSALESFRLAEPNLAKRVLVHTLKLDPVDGSWLADLGEFDIQERKEMVEVMRMEGLALADRSKLRRMIDHFGMLIIDHSGAFIQNDPKFQEHSYTSIFSVPQMAKTVRPQSAPSNRFRLQEAAASSGSNVDSSSVSGDGASATTWVHGSFI